MTSMTMTSMKKTMLTLVEMTKGPLQGREQAVRLAERCKEKNTEAERPAENPLQLEAPKPLSEPLCHP